MPRPQRQGPAVSERATNCFSNFKNSIQTKWQKLNFGGSAKRTASPSSTVFPVEKPPSTFYLPAQSPDNYFTIPEYSTQQQIPQTEESKKGVIKSILKKPKIRNNGDNAKYSVITPASCKEAQSIPRWQWNTQMKEKTPYERVIEDRVEREENCVKGRLVAVERLMRTTTTTKNASNNQHNIYWPGTGLNRTFI
ncbi:hypothetical protein ACQ4LE_008381 [Meloidogyne hapla]|uniref:Uncharacterized protein n=1 Tax=Meloidogyne hapla TaxID=6305 RepID=A0A1I8BPE5_MELHA